MHGESDAKNTLYHHIIRSSDHHIITNTKCLKDHKCALFLKIWCLTDWLIRTLAEMLPNSWKSSGSRISIMMIISSYQFDGAYRRLMDAIFFCVKITCCRRCDPCCISIPWPAWSWLTRISCGEDARQVQGKVDSCRRMDNSISFISSVRSSSGLIEIRSSSSATHFLDFSNSSDS